MPQETSKELKSPDLSEGLISIDAAETDEELLLGRDLLAALIKTIKAFHVYPPDNPALKSFNEQLHKKLQLFLKKYHLFAVEIGEHTFSFKGKALYQNTDVRTSLAYLFYKDGLRELRFLEGVEDREIYGLIDLIRQSEHINQLEDDLVTLLWERDFSHIGYLATDEFLDETPILIPETVGEFRQNVVSGPPDHEVEIDRLGEIPGAGGLLSKVIEGQGMLNRSVYALDADEVERLRSEVAAEVSPGFVFSVIDILFEILAMEKQAEPFQAAVGVLDKALDAFLTLAEFEKASDLLKRFYIMLKTYKFKDWQADMIRKLIIGAGNERRIELIGRAMEKEEGIRLEDVNGYLVLLQRNSIKPLINLLGNLKDSKTRRVLCDTLAQIGKNVGEMFVPFIDDGRWYVVRNIVYILGRIGEEQSLPHIEKIMSHVEPRVRREAAQAFGLIGGPKAVGLLIKSLKDEDARVRAMAALNLGKVGKRDGLGPLLGVVQSKEFSKKEPMEIKAFFDAIGMTGSNDSIPLLQQLLERKSWFSRGKTDDVLRMGAATALGMIGTPEALGVLKAGRDSKDESIRSVCLQALRGKSV